MKANQCANRPARITKEGSLLPPPPEKTRFQFFLRPCKYEELVRQATVNRVCPAFLTSINNAIQHNFNKINQFQPMDMRSNMNREGVE